MQRPDTDLLILRYLDREVSDSERQIVEERMRSDDAFALRVREHEASGRVMEYAVATLAPDKNLLANIMGRVAAEAESRHRPAVVGMPETGRARKGLSVRLRAVAAAAAVAVIVGVALLVVHLTTRTAEKPPMAITASTEGAVHVAAESGARRALAASEALQSGETIIAGSDGKADITAGDWRWKLNNDTSLTYLGTEDKAIIVKMAEGEVWADNTTAMPPQSLRVETSFGSIAAKDANFDVKIDTVSAPAEAGESRELKRITLVVSRGAVSYKRGGETYVLRANDAVQEDAGGRFVAPIALSQATINGMMDWWDSGTVSTPDIEKLPPVRRPRPPITWPAKPPMQEETPQPQPEKGAPKPAGMLVPEAVYIKIDAIDGERSIRCTMAAEVNTDKEKNVFYSYPTINVGEMIGGVVSIERKDDNGAKQVSVVDFTTGAKLVQIVNPAGAPAGPERTMEQRGGKLSPEEAAQMPGVKPSQPATPGTTPWLPKPEQGANAAQPGSQPPPPFKPHVIIRTKDGREITLAVGDTYDFSSP